MATRLCDRMHLNCATLDTEIVNAIDNREMTLDRNHIAANWGGRGVKREPLDHTGVLNLAGKYLARRTDAPVADYAEPWRFPIVESHHAGNDGPGNTG